MEEDSERLGEVRAEFRPKMINLVAGIILGLGLALGGGAGVIAAALYEMPTKGKKEVSDVVGKYVFVALLLVIPAAGVALLLWMRRLVGHRVTVFERGFSYYYAGLLDVVPWSEVEKIIEVFTHEQVNVIKVPGTGIANLDRSFSVIRKDGKNFTFNVNSVNRMRRLAECLEEARDRHGVAWETIEQ